MALNVEIIENWETFGELSSEWDRLLNQSDANSVFLTWSWMDAWRQTTGESVQPIIVIVRTESGELVGLLPLWLSNMKLLSFLCVRALRFLGDSCNALEYPDCIVHPDWSEEVLPALARAVQSMEVRWDIIWLPNCADHPAAARRWSTFERDAAYTRSRPAQFSRLRLPESWQDYENSLAANQRQKHRRLVRKFQSLGGQFEVCETLRDAGEFLSAMYELHNKRWREAGQPGSFIDRPAVTGFYQCLLPKAFSEGRVFLTGYRLNGQLKAVQFGFLYGGRYSQVQEGFDPDLPGGLGNALRYFSMQQCIEQGADVYDFLGGHTEHKRRWGGVCHEGFDQLIVRQQHTLRGAIIGLVFRKAWPTGRWIRDYSRNLLDQAAIGLKR